MKVEVVEFNPEWKEQFNLEKLLIIECFGNLVEKVHHIGSTAVSGLAAKPIIDIIIEVRSLSALGQYKSKIELLGYEAMGEFEICGRRYYRKGGINRSHQIHAFKSDDANVKRHIAFRDYLKSYPVVAREYERLKIELARTCNVSDYESTPINSRNNPSILSAVPNTGESHVQRSTIRNPGQLLAATH